MSNQLLLCHACFTWVFPRNDDCPECGRQIKLGDPDPPRSTLQEILGSVLFPIGRIRVRRKHLPEHGLLYATTMGLFFLPDRQQDEDATGGGDDLRPQLLQPNESRRLVEFLMENPGVFFVPRKSMRAMTRRFGRWTIRRVDGSRLRLRPETDVRMFHSKMHKLIESESWQQVTEGTATR